MPRGPAWTAEEKAKLLELAKAGLQWRQVAAQLPGRSAQACHTIARSMRRAGLLPADRRAAAAAMAPAPLPPRRGSRLDVLLRHLQRLAQAGQPMGTLEALAHQLFDERCDVASSLLRQLEARGMVVVDRAPAGIVRVAAPDGSWEVAGSAHAAAAAGPQRRCLSCRKPFQAEHRGNFVCHGCKGTDAWQTGIAA